MSESLNKPDVSLEEGYEVSNEYGADQIQILEGLEAVRKRPGMYIGSTSTRGLHHLVYEIVDNSVDEALAGFCKNIQVFINEDNSITVIDDGRGIPVGIQEKTGRPAVEVVFTVLHAGGKFGGGGYKVSGGLHGVGSSVVNALSDWLEVEVSRDGKVYKQRYERGNICYDLKVIGDTETPDYTGTKVTFKPDATIFDDVIYDYDTLRVRLRETAFLTKGLRISLTDLRPPVKGEEESDEDFAERSEKWEPKSETFHYEGGIKEFVTYLNRHKTVIYDKVIYCEGVRDNIYVEVALQHNNAYNEMVYSFVNNIITPEGGMHLTGFRSAMTKVFNDYARNNKLLKEKDDNLSGEDLREGLTAIISVKIEDPQFEGQTKQKLGNAPARTAVESLMNEQLVIFLEQNLHGRFPLYVERMLYIPLTITTILLLNRIFRRTPKWFNNAFKFVGALSLECYLIHIHFVLNYIPKEWTYWATFLMCTAITLPAAWCLSKVVGKLEKTLS